MAKKQSNEEKIIATLDAMDSVKGSLDRYANRCNDYIDEAAIRGDDAKAKELIKVKIHVLTLIRKVESIKSSIEFGAYTSKALSALATLPNAIAGCKGLLAETPDFTKLGKNLSSIFNDISKAEKGLANLSDSLNPKLVDNNTSRLDGVDEIETSDLFKAEYAAMIDRVGDKTKEAMVSVPKTDSNISATGVVDYDGIMGEEKGKK